MAHVSLYRRFRPSSWDKVIGQDHIVTTLINQIKSDAVSHAYLFTGTRGTGKTSSAKIFAKAVNCQNPVNGSPCGICDSCRALADPSNLDIIEMDAASNNGVDEIRELKENVQYPPASVRYKVYIIDEVHMLSSSAFNALLKTLEEPPKHVIFILATTEVHKLPQTILSRCLRFDFRLVSKEKLVGLLQSIFTEIGYSADTEALELLALHGEGSVRDTLSLADMCLSYAPDKLTAEAALEVLGASDYATLAQIAEGVLNGNAGAVLAATNKIYARGKGISALNKDLGAFFRDLIAVKNIPGYTGSFGDAHTADQKRIAEAADNYKLGRAMDLLAQVENLIRYSTQPQIVLDACLIRAAELQTSPNIEALLSRVRTLESRLAAIESGTVKIETAQTPVPSAPPLPNVAETLAKIAESVETAPVFEDAPEDTAPQIDEKAKSVMSALMTALREKGSNIIYRALSKQEDYSFENNILTVRISDAANWTLLTAGGNPEVLRQTIRETVGADCGVELTRLINKTEIKHESRNTLAELFGDRLQDKNIK